MTNDEREEILRYLRDISAKLDHLDHTMRVFEALITRMEHKTTNLLDDMRATSERGSSKQEPQP